MFFVKSLLELDHKFKIASKDDIIMNNYKNEPHRTKALINPFDPSNVTSKLTSNRRRWVHVFPRSHHGILMQIHHTFEPKNQIPKEEHFSISAKRSSFDQVDFGSFKADEPIYKRNAKNRNFETISKKSALSDHIDSHQKSRSLLTDNSSLWAWGATGKVVIIVSMFHSLFFLTGELEWTHAITTGVDWKSLVIPACLPITTDFLPDTRTLQQDYVTYAYDLLPEDQANDFFQQRFLTLDEDLKKSNTLTTDRVYIELICQRLQQGFQLILQPKSEMVRIDKYKYILSIGRIYHELLLKESKITITYYHPRHPYNAKNIQYCYRIRTPDNETYGISWVEFVGEKLESYKWNYLDNYICLRGDSDYQLIESLKYWRFRLLVLPTMHTITKKIIDKYLNKEDDFNCDLYHAFTIEEKLQLQAGFLKLIEIINRIKRPISKQTHRSEASKSALNRRNSSTMLGSQAAIDTSSHHNRHSQPTDVLLSTINESQPRIENLSLKTDELASKTNEATSWDNEERLTDKSPHRDILAAMLSSKYSPHLYAYI